MDFKPTAGEIANIWKFIVGNEGQLCILEHFSKQAEDKELKRLLERSKVIANVIIQEGKEVIFKRWVS